MGDDNRQWKRLGEHVIPEIRVDYRNDVFVDCIRCQGLALEQAETVLQQVAIIAGPTSDLKGIVLVSLRSVLIVPSTRVF